MSLHINKTTHTHTHLKSQKLGSWLSLPPTTCMTLALLFLCLSFTLPICKMMTLNWMFYRLTFNFQILCWNRPCTFGHGVLFRPISFVALCVGHPFFDTQTTLQTFPGTEDFIFFLVDHPFIFLLGRVQSIIFFSDMPLLQVSILKVWGGKKPSGYSVQGRE